MARFVVLVIDSFGVGAMADVPEVRPQDIGANTCGHILQRFPALRLPTLEKLGLINALGFAPGVMQEPQSLNMRAVIPLWGIRRFLGPNPEPRCECHLMLLSIRLKMRCLPPDIKQSVMAKARFGYWWTARWRLAITWKPIWGRFTTSPAT